MFTKLIPDIEKDEVYIDGLSGFVAGIFATTLAHPLDSICARIMTGTSKDRSVYGNAKAIIQTEGVMVLWRGLLPSMMGTVVSSTIFALAYEYIKRASKD
jgi:solute carrier family 25 phosphate transporter 23/24/25/41